MEDLESDVLCANENNEEKPIISIIELCGLFAFAFGNGVLISSYFIVTLPIESRAIDVDNRAMILGGFVAVAGITQLICPIVGLYSDRCKHKWGKRRPFIFYGGILGVIGLLAQMYCRANSFWWSYLFWFTISMIALNTIYSSMNGLIPDFVPESQTGVANGIIAFLSVCGAVSSFVVFQFLQKSMEMFYLFYAVTIAITVALTFSTAGRLDSVKGNQRNDGTYDYYLTSHSGKVTMDEIKLSFYVSPTHHHDFFLILVSRTLFYMGISSQTFLMYYLRDKLSIPEVDAESFTAVLAVAGQFCGILTALPTGYISDKKNTGRKKFIYIACFILAVCNLALIVANSKNLIFWITCLLGMGNGIYLTSDASLAIDALPNKQEAARFMGVWGVGAFIGTALGPIVSGPILNLTASGEPNQDGIIPYGMGGYTFLLGISAVYFFGSAYVLKYTHIQ